MSARALLAVALLLAPSLLGVAAPAAGAADALPLPRLAPRDAFRVVDEGLSSLGVTGHRAPLSALPRVGALADVDLALSAPSEDARLESEWTEPAPATGVEWWINDSDVDLGFLHLSPGETLRVRNSTIRLEEVYVDRGATLHVEDARIVPSEGRPTFWTTTFGEVRLTRTHVEGMDGDLYGSPEGSVLLDDCDVEVGQAWLRLWGAEAAARNSVFYNGTSQGLMLAENATAEGSAFVNNMVGVVLAGWGARLVGSDVSFNLVGIRWEGGQEAVVQGNNVHDNYVDGLQGPAAGQATLDVSGNWWSGTPNVDGDSWSGTGISSSSHAAAPFPVPDLLHRLPFTPLRVTGGTTWTGPVALSGPTIVRGGALTLDGATVEGRGFVLGSHASSRLVTRDSTIEDAHAVLSRSDDSFTTTRFVAAAPLATGSALGGLVAMGGTPTVRGNTFDRVPVALVVAPRALGMAPPAVTVEDNAFEDTAIGAILVLAQPTFRRNTMDGALIGILSVLSTSVVLNDNLVHDSLLGIVTALDQGFTASGNSVYGSTIGFALLATTSPTVTGYEGRGNALNFAALGAQVTITASNLYDNPLFGILAYDFTVPDPATGQPVGAPGRVRVDPTTYAADVDRGNVERVPPQKSSPSATPGRAPLVPPDIVAAGETRVLAGNVTLTGPLVVRSGGALEVRGANVTGPLQIVGAMPGGRLVVENSTFDGLSSLIVHTGNARIEDSVLRNATFYSLVLAESNGALVRGSVFDGPTRVLVCDAAATLERDLFLAGLEVVTTVSPKREARVVESVFPRQGITVMGDPPLRVLRSSFLDGDGVRDDEAGILGSPPGDGSVSVDARDVWWNSADGPSRPGQWTGGAWVSWPHGKAPVLFDPWLAQPFRASFTPSTTLTTDVESVAFTDTSFDLDGAIVSREWDFGDGSPNSTEQSPTHAFQGHGEKTVRLTVTDSYGLVSTAEAKVLVKAVPVAALAGPTESLTLDELTFDASSSTDADGAIASYTFTFSDGRVVGPQASPVAQHAFQRPGAQSVTVVARDDEGYASLPVVLPVTLQNRAPTASFLASPLPTTRADDTAFLSTSVDPDGTIVEATWDFGDGTASASGASLTHRYAALGSYVATLTVVDDFGATATHAVQVDVVNALPQATLDVLPRYLHPTETATLATTAADRDGSVVDVAWDLGDGTAASGASVTHAYAEEGDYLVRLTVTDNDGGVTTLERVVPVRWNFPPLPTMTVVRGLSDASFGFRDESADPDGTVASRLWDFGEGRTSTQRNVSFTFREPGLHTVRLTVTDEKGAAATAERVLDVDDVLALAAQVEPRGPTTPPLLHLRTAWLNGTGVPASYALTVTYLTPSGQRVLWSTASGVTAADGRAAIALSGPVPLVPPGRYEVALRTETREGYGGNLESAGGTLAFAVAYP